ncbi:MAG: isopentenyl-diphosphate Delta-isomerase [Bauldia sp.]
MASTDHDLVILVNEADNSIGRLDKIEAHRRGSLHRALSVLVADDDGRLLLQKRAAGKYHSGGLWTNACCSHPRPGEAVTAAASRRLAEEMGFSCALSPMFTARYRSPVSNGLIENEIVHVFGGRSDRSPSPDRAEVEDWRFDSLAAIDADVAAAPARYSVWFRKYLLDYRAHFVGTLGLA